MATWIGGPIIELWTRDQRPTDLAQLSTTIKDHYDVGYLYITITAQDVDMMLIIHISLLPPTAHIGYRYLSHIDIRNPILSICI